MGVTTTRSVWVFWSSENAAEKPLTFLQNREFNIPLISKG
jgi:hypothetical protein